MTITFSFLPTSPHLSFPYVMVTESGLPLQVPEGGVIPKQETINFYVRIPKDLMEWIVPLPFLAKLGLTVNAAILSNGKNGHGFCVYMTLL